MYSHRNANCSLSEFRRDLQAKIANVNVNINIGPSVENYGGETFLSQEVSINILQETKLAFKRCEMVSTYKPCYGKRDFTPSQMT